MYRFLKSSLLAIMLVAGVYTNSNSCGYRITEEEMIVLGITNDQGLACSEIIFDAAEAAQLDCGN